MTTTILLLVGTSSAGKSTLAKQLQAILPDHYLLLGLDDVFRMVSPRWGGGLAGPLSYQGFRYDHSSAPPTITLRYGAVGRAVLDGMHQAVAAFAQAGTNVIVDIDAETKQKLRKPTRNLKGTMLFHARTTQARRRSDYSRAA